MKKGEKKTYDINYVYQSENKGKNFDKLIEMLFKKYLINYEK